MGFPPIVVQSYKNKTALSPKSSAQNRTALSLSEIHFFCPFSPSFLPLDLLRGGTKLPLSFPRNLTLTCSDAPLSRLPHLYIIYRGALRFCGGGDANHYWSVLGPVVVTHIDQ